MSCGDLQAPGSGTNDTNDIDIDNDKDATAVEDNGPRTLYTGQVDAFVKILRSEGLRGLFAGMPAGLLQTFLSSLSYFVLYASLRQRAQAQLAALAGPGRKLSTSAELVLGAVAGGLSRCLTTPVSVVTTRRQTAVARSASASAGYVQTVLEIVRSHGIGGLWSGLGPSLILTVNPAITYGLFERLKGIVAGRAGRRLTPGQVALMGALTKSLATIVTYPYILAKVRMQSDRGAGGRGKGQGKGKAGTGLVGTLRECVAEGGLGGLYRGLGAQIGKAVVCQALLFVIKDALEAGVRRHLLRRR
ncbi:mitochondrial carrier domain-containing protein [Entophlyctis helioformis]|nr:mitochondrial carrier domain-containing protein [Entophlyctis helioformis]